MAVRRGTVRRHGALISSTRRLQATLIAVFVTLTLLPGSGLAAPGGQTSQPDSSTVNLGGGAYQVVASVFAEGTDGQAGTQASSGHWITTNDNLVALPGCTESSCPWVPTGTGTEGRYGPQTTCAEADGLCWVKIVSNTTGKCTVAPVHDRGPLFVRDNWWAPQSQREYNVPQGIPAAEYARDGVDFGFGPGISDVGNNIKDVYRYAAGIDIAGGTWKALGLATSTGITTVTVTMLWQAGITHDQACGGSSSSGSGSGTTAGANAATTTGLNLRSTSSTSGSVVTLIPSGARIKVTGQSVSGFYPVTYLSSSGWASGDYIRFDSGADPGASSGSSSGSGSLSGSMYVIGGSLNLRSGAGTGYSVVTLMPNGAKVTLTGQSSGSWRAVTYNGMSGWAHADYLSTSAPSSSGSTSGASGGGTARTTAGVNLRSGAGTSYGVLLVVPSGASVTLAGSTSNGFTRVTYNGTTGWLSSTYLTTGSSSSSSGSSSSATGTGTVIDGTLNLRSGPGTGYGVLVVMPDSATVTLLGESQNGFVKVTYKGTTGWASSTYIRAGGSSSSSTGSGTATVIDGSLNLRATASTSGQVLLVMPDGARVTLLGETQNGFTKVSYNGTTGWAYSIYLR
ncbi:MAG: SH3 domain-containing protein [Thermomicrobiales bacterium]|nr:SH3 domain-containing protein [Thermomicrobiales bacterium]